MKVARLCVSLLMVATVGGCAYPDLRSAVHSNFGSQAIAMRPPLEVPATSSILYKTNSIRFIPGAIATPNVLNERNYLSGQAAEWGSHSTNYCRPSRRLYQLNDTGPNLRLGDIVIEYSRDFSLAVLLNPLTGFRYAARHASGERNDLERARVDFQLSKNDIRSLRRISIKLTNIVYYQAGTEKLEAARRDILAKITQGLCRQLTAQSAQVMTIYAADLDVDVQAASGASVDVGIIKGKIVSALSYHEQGRNVFFALLAAPVK